MWQVEIMAILTKDQILNIDDRKTEIVAVPEWGGEVIVQTMTGFARDKFETNLSSTTGVNNMQNIRAKFAAACIVDEEGNLMFDDKDLIKLGNKSSAALDRIFAVAQRLNIMTDAEVEQLAKNL